MTKPKQLTTLADLTPDAANVNKGSERGAYMLDWSLTNLGAGRSILADADGHVIAGNKTLDAAVERSLPIRVVQTDGKELVVVQRTDLRLQGKGKERSTARSLAVADNRASEVGYVPDVEVLLSHMQSGVDLSPMFLEDEIKALLDSLTPAIEPGGGGDEFDTTPVDGPTRCQVGDLWVIGGKHRLLCGDSTKAEDVARLMGGGNAGLCVTSPPYFNQRPEYSSWDSYEDYNEFLRQILSSVLSVAGDPFILAWNTGDNQPDCLPMIADQTCLIHSTGLTYLDTIIWRKAGAVYSIPRSAHIRTNHYFYPALAWEPIIIFRKGDAMPKFDASDEDYVSAFHVNVWEISQVIGSQQEKVGHPAMYPIELASRVMRCYSTTGAVVFDPFLGSGTTLIAAHRENRIAYGLEIEPKYCDVILKRAEAEGLSAERVT